MAKREALRDLQTRLAGRLQSAKTEGLSAAWLAVRAAGVNYLFPLAQSGEIFPAASIQAVPYVRPWFLGVANLRGGLYGIVDLAAFVADGTGQKRSEQSLLNAGVVTLNGELDLNCALLVDELAGLRHLEAFKSSEPPAPGSAAYWGHRYTDSEGQQWQEINLQQMAQSPQFLSISA